MKIRFGTVNAEALCCFADPTESNAMIHKIPNRGMMQVQRQKELRGALGDLDLKFHAIASWKRPNGFGLSV